RSAVPGGWQLVPATIGLALAAFVLAIGAGGWPAVGVLFVLVAVVLVQGWRVARRRSGWTADRLAVASDLVEQMLGHRTRLAQLPRGRWNDGEDRALDRYHAASADLDRAAMRLEVLIPRLWVVAGLLLLAPGFVTATAAVTALAIGVGGVLLARQALQQLAEGLGRLAGAVAAWRYV